MTEREAICEFHFHRGLKPANIKITPESKVKVLDFGLARVLAGDVAAGNLATSPTLTIAATTIGVILGTAAYMSPEQARGAVAGKRSSARPSPEICRTTSS